MSLRSVIAELDNIVTYPWDQQLRGQLMFWTSIADLATKAEDDTARSRLVAELKSQLRQWIGGIQENPWQWDYHGADVDAVIKDFESALLLTDTDLAAATAFVTRAYENIGVS